MPTKPHIIVIVGPTASGKTELSIRTAKKTSGEVISADSRQVYKGLDAGTGKITTTEMSGVPHHLLDVADPRDTFTADDYLRLGRIAIADILARKKTPIIVGGTGFYIDALLGSIVLPPVAANPEFRKSLETQSVAVLFNELVLKDPERAEGIDRQNKVRLIRALEIIDVLGKVPVPSTVESLYTVEWIGIDWSDDALQKRIAKRLTTRFDAIVAEVKSLHKKGVTWDRFEELGLEYRYVGRLVQNKIDRATCIAELQKEIWQYAKRQRTYWKKNPEIAWRIQDSKV